MPDDEQLARQSGVRGGLARAGLFALTYFAASELGYSLSLGPSVGGTFWPPAGLTLGVLLATAPSLWPALLAAGAAANFTSDVLHGQVLPASTGFAMANLGEPLLGAVLLRRLNGGPVTLLRVQELVTLAFTVVFVTTPLAAAVGAVTAELWTPDPPGFVAGWRTWWVGDAVGALVLAPFVLAVMTSWRRRLPARAWLEGAAFLAAVWLTTSIVFTAPPTALAMPFLVFPVLLWASLRLGPVGVGAGLCLVVVLTAHDTAAGRGPFAADALSLGDRLVALQIYVGVMALSFHGLSVLWGERARTAAALRVAHSGLEARYRRIVEQSPLGIVSVQADGRVRDANPAWLRLRAPAAAGNVGAPPGGRDAALEPLIAGAFAGDIVELPEREIVVDGDAHDRSRRVRGVAYPIKDEAGRVGEVVLIERDITDERRAQQQLVEANRALREREEALSHAIAQMADAQAHREQLLAAERFARGEAERASQLKDEFLATLSHELRTPLSAIVGWAHILRRSARDPALAQAVETIERNARAQTRLIDDLLDMSRIMAGKVGLSIARVRLAEVVTAAADALRPVADDKGVRLSIDTAGGQHAWVSGDPSRLQQVVANVLGNGIKFTPAGGRVDVEVVSRDQDARVIVRDTGQGIPAEFLPVVFERFRQADGSFSRRHGGLGLGLSIARQLVELHGGTIAAHSDGPDRGAVFTIALPAAAPEDVRESPPLEGNPPVSLIDVRVLVVDDEPDARELLRRLLVEQGCVVACAASAEEALKELAARPFDLLLTDIGMPGTDGYELLRLVRAGNRVRPRVVAVTAFARLEDRDRALAAGFDGHLSKPFSPAQLLKTLGALWVPRPMAQPEV